MSARAIPFTKFRAECEAMYQADRARKTFLKVRQGLREIGDLGVESTEDLTPPVIARWLKSRPDRGYWTRVSLFSSIRAAMGYAARRRYVETNPFEAWEFNLGARPKLPEMHHSAEALARVFERAAAEAPMGWKERRLQALFATAAFTGMRKLEILRLRMEDLDLENGVIEIVARVGNLKTPGSEQPIPCPDILIAFLRDWTPRAGSDWLFPHCRRTGPWLEGKQRNKPLDSLKALGERAGVKGLTFQSLRHSWATHGESLWGIPDTVIQRVLRHTTLRTQQKYRHADIPNLRAQVKSISFARPGSSTGEGMRHGQATAV